MSLAITQHAAPTRVAASATPAIGVTFESFIATLACIVTRIISGWDYLSPDEKVEVQLTFVIGEGDRALTITAWISPTRYPRYRALLCLTAPDDDGNNQLINHWHRQIVQEFKERITNSGGGTRTWVNEFNELCCWILAK